MEFNPNNKIVQLCIQGMDLESKGKTAEATSIFLDAWNKSEDDLEKYLAAYYLAKIQSDPREKLKWFEVALQHALKSGSLSANSGLPALYSNLSECCETLNDPAGKNKYVDLAETAKNNPADKGPFYHGTKADLKTGDLLTAGFNSNYQATIVMNHIYFTAIANGAGLAAELAPGDRPARVYVVEPTGTFENDPNVTDKKFPGNPTRSYRSASPLKVTGEITDWKRLTPEELKAWREKLAKLDESKGEIIN